MKLTSTQRSKATKEAAPPRPKGPTGAGGMRSGVPRFLHRPEEAASASVPPAGATISTPALGAPAPAPEAASAPALGAPAPAPEAASPIPLFLRPPATGEAPPPPGKGPPAARSPRGSAPPTGKGPPGARGPAPSPWKNPPARGPRGPALPFAPEMERAFGHDFSDVVVRFGSLGAVDARAAAFREGGRDVVMFESPSPAKEQVAHELTHVVQRRRSEASPRGLSARGDASEREARAAGARAAVGLRVEVSAPPGGALQRDDEVDDAAARIHADLHGFIDDEQGALDELRASGDSAGTASTYLARYSVALWADFVGNASGDILRQALALLWPHMTVLERLETRLSFWDDDEEGILQVIESASDAELAAVRDGIQPYLDQLGAADQYRARCRIWPDQPVTNVVWLLENGNGIFSDEEGASATAILSLTPEQRVTLWDNHQGAFGMFDEADRARIRHMCVTDTGDPVTEAEAIQARMSLATIGAGTDEEGVQAAVAAAASRRDERARLEEWLNTGRGADGEPLTDEARQALQRRVDAIGDVDELLTAHTAPGGELDEESFLGMAQGDIDTASMSAILSTARVGAYQRAKQEILAAAGILDDDEDAILTALRNVRGEVTLAEGEAMEDLSPEEIRIRQEASAASIRLELLQDPDLESLWNALNEEETGYAVALASGDTYSAAIYELTQAFEGIDTDEREILRILQTMPEADRIRMRDEPPVILWRIRLWPLDPRFRTAFDTALETGRVPTEQALNAAYGGWGDTTDEAMAEDAFARMTEEERRTYRRGYLLARGAGVAVASPEDEAALSAYRTLRERMEAEYSDEELDLAMARLLGLPSVEEIQSGEGRIDAATLMYERQRERLELGGGLTDIFTTTDETAEAAHIEYAARYHLAMESGDISLEEFAVLISLDEQFHRRFESYAATVNIVSEIAGTVASVVACVIVIALSGGTATPAAGGVLAWLSANSALLGGTAAASAMAQVAASEAFGGSFNEMIGAEGAQQALSGLINGALAVAGAALAERAATLVGLSGRALTAQIARSAAQSTETALAGRGFARGALTGFIDGFVSGAVGELVMTLTDSETWKRTVWGVLAQIGGALLRGGLLGGGTGAVLGGLLEMAQALLRARALRNCVVEVDEALGTGAHIDFQVGDDGAISGLTLRFGPQVTEGDLAAHVDRIASISRAGGLLQRARRALLDVQDFPPNTRAFEAAEELPKIEDMIRDRLRQLRGGGLSPQSSEVIQAELDVLESNLDHFAGVVARGDLTPGTGRIGRPDAPAGYPPPPDGHYYRRRDGGWDLQRYPDRDDIDPMTLEPVPGGGFRVVGRTGVAEPAVPFPEGTSRETAFEMLTGADSRSSFKQYWEMLRDNHLATRDEVLAAMLEPGGRTEDVVRHALKEHFGGRVLTRARQDATGRVYSEAESLVELRRLTANLNPSDRGNITERWYAAMRGEGLVAHPEMLPELNPDLEDLRRPDFIQGSTAVEVKSTAQGLGERDIDQIGDMLDVCAARGTVSLRDGTTRQVTAMRLVFSDIRGARGSATQLQRWLNEYAGLTIEVYGRNGARVTISRTTLPALQTEHGVGSLADLLEAL